MTRRLLRLAFVLLMAAAPFAGRPLTAQQPDAGGAPQTPTFRTRIDNITVDLVVTDRQGRPIKDLKPEEVEVREGGKVQTIETFKLIETDDGLDDPAARRDILSMQDQERELTRSENRIFVLFLDDYHVRQANSVRIREELAQFLSMLTPHDLVAIMTPLLPPAALTFSRHHDAMASEVLKFVGRKYDYRPRNALEERYASDLPAVQEQMRNNWVIAGLRALCDYLGTIRDGRKTILYVSEGLSTSLPSGVATQGTQVPIPRRGIPAPDPVGRQASQQVFDSASLMSDLQVVFSAASRANTAIYTLDPRGLATSEFSLADVVTSTADARVLGESSDNLRTIAGETNGRAIVGRNDPTQDLQQMVSDSRTYYLLSYTSSLSPRDGKFHEIQVRVRRPGVEVRARKGYWAMTNEDVERAMAPPKPLPASDVTDALDGLASVSESLRRHAVTLWMGAGRGVANSARVTLAWEASSDPTLLPADRAVRVAVTAVSVSGETVFRGEVAPDAAAGPSLGHIQFDAPPGLVRAKVEAINAAGRRVESTDASINVPDFTSPGPIISTPFVFRGRTARDLQQIRTTAEPAPVVIPVFSRTERILVRFGAYGPGGTDPVVSVRLLNRSGTQIATLPPPGRVNALFECEMGFASFPPGDYLLEITAKAGESTSKSLVALRVTG